MSKIYLIVHDIRSCHNVGSLLRTADGLGIDKVFLTGYTPYPALRDDSRLPHLAAKIHRQIAKTSLGAEKSVDWQKETDLSALIGSLKGDGFTVAALEQSQESKKLPHFQNRADIALIVGNEAEGLDKETLGLVDECLEIPMLGQKESFNVANAAAMALYHLRYFSDR